MKSYWDVDRWETGVAVLGTDIATMWNMTVRIRFTCVTIWRESKFEGLAGFFMFDKQILLDKGPALKRLIYIHRRAFVIQ